MKKIADHVMQKTIKACDFDGTLAFEMHPYDRLKAGPPVPKMLALVKKWIKDGEQIVIFTSRVCTATHTNLELKYARKLISAWCKHYLGKTFPITAEKHPQFEIWDNKAHRVQTNTGKILASKRSKKHMVKEIVNYYTQPLDILKHAS